MGLPFPCDACVFVYLPLLYMFCSTVCLATYLPYSITHSTHPLPAWFIHYLPLNSDPILSFVPPNTPSPLPPPSPVYLSHGFSPPYSPLLVIPLCLVPTLTWRGSLLPHYLLPFYLPCALPAPLPALPAPSVPHTFTHFPGLVPVGSYLPCSAYHTFTTPQDNDPAGCLCALQPWLPHLPSALPVPMWSFTFPAPHFLIHTPPSVIAYHTRPAVLVSLPYHAFLYSHPTGSSLPSSALHFGWGHLFFFPYLLQFDLFYHCGYPLPAVCNTLPVPYCLLHRTHLTCNVVYVLLYLCPLPLCITFPLLPVQSFPGVFFTPGLWFTFFVSFVTYFCTLVPGLTFHTHPTVGWVHHTPVYVVVPLYLTITFYFGFPPLPLHFTLPYLPPSRSLPLHCTPTSYVAPCVDTTCHTWNPSSTLVYLPLPGYLTHAFGRSAHCIMPYLPD